MHELNVNIPSIPSSSYPIQIADGTLSGLWEKLENKYPSERKFLVTDANLVSVGHLETLTNNRKVDTFVIDPPGEISKHVNTAIAIIEKMEKAFMGRDSVIVALGGGTVGDIAGFAAAIFKRGIKVVQIPTTTVSQADSSVGGKTGVDSTISKNAFGAFWQPDAVYIDVETLRTLDDTQYRSGLVESVKHALIADADYFEFFENNMAAVLKRDTEVLKRIACHNCSIKAAVVEQDPTEKNMRRILNYGHTIGHAVESASNFDLLHGQAVAIGIIGATIIEQHLGYGDQARTNRISKVLEELGMELTIPKGIKKDTLIDLIKRDKKAVNKWPKFVLLKEIGQALCVDDQWAHDITQEAVETALDRLF